MKYSIKLTILFIALLLFPSSPFTEQTYAWGGTSHQYLIEVATSYLENVVDDLDPYGERWPQLFIIYESQLKLGSIAPDREFGDSYDHVYHLDNPSNAPNKVRNWYESFKAHLITGNYSYAVWSAGVMSHYVADLCQPMHTDEVFKEDDTSQTGLSDGGHVLYERDTNSHIDEINFQAYTPVELQISVEQTTIDCAYFSNTFHDDLVETYWNGSFWTPWVESATTILLNYAAQRIADIIYTGILEVNVTLPDFTTLAINSEINIPNQLNQGSIYTGTITLTDWNGSPLDANIFITRTWVEYNEDNTSEETPASAGPFIVLYSHEETGIYTFELNISKPGTVYLEINIDKPNMISKTDVIELTIIEAELTTMDTSTSSSEHLTTTEQKTPSFTLFSVLLTTMIAVICVRKYKH